MKKQLALLVFLGSCSNPVPAVEATHWLVVSVETILGDYQSFAVKYKSMADCEKSIPKAMEVIRRSKDAIKGYVMVCSKISDASEAS